MYRDHHPNAKVKAGLARFEQVCVLNCEGLRVLRSTVFEARLGRFASLLIERLCAMDQKQVYSKQVLAFQ